MTRMAATIRVFLLAAGFGIVSLWAGCGNNYYVHYPKYWVPAGCPLDYDAEAVLEARSTCKMAAMDYRYLDRRDRFLLCMEVEGYRREWGECR